MASEISDGDTMGECRPKVVNVSLPNSAALVIFEMLSRQLDPSGERSKADVGVDDAEKLALNELLGQLERRLVEPFDARYMQLLEEAKSDLLNRGGGLTER